MQTVDMGRLIRDIVVKFSAQRTNELPPVRLTISPSLSAFYWRDDSLERLLREIFNEVLKSNRVDLPVRIKVSSRARLQDLQAFIGLSPLYWIQIKVSGHGLPCLDVLESKLQHTGYYCEEWIGTENATSQLAIFCSGRGGAPKLVLYLSTCRFKWECDFLIPILANCLPDAD